MLYSQIVTQAGERSRGLLSAAVPLMVFSFTTGNAFLTGEAFGQGGPALVEVQPVVAQKVSEGQTFVGTVTPSRRAAIGSAVDGRVIDLKAHDGDRVQANEPLADLLTETIKLELEAAKAELILRTEERKELDNGSRQSEIDEAKARLEAAQANLDFRNANARRTMTLFEQRGATTQQQVDEAVAQAKTARADVDAAKAEYELVVEGPRAEQKAQAVAREKMQEAVVAKLEDQIKKYTIRSRFTGYVVKEHTEVGEWLNRGDLVAEVIALDQVDVMAQVIEGQIPYVKLGSSVRIAVPAVPEHVFVGKVMSVTPEGDSLSRTFPVKIRVANEFEPLTAQEQEASSDTSESETERKGQPVLKAGMLTQVYLQTGAEVNATLVPKDALVLGGASPMVWLIDSSTIQSGESKSIKTGGARMVPVRLGVSNGPLIQVIGEIPEGSFVVTLGNERLRPSRGPDPTPVSWIVKPATSGGGPGT